MKKVILAVSASMLLFSCGGNKEEKAAPAEETTVANPVEEPVAEEAAPTEEAAAPAEDAAKGAVLEITANDQMQYDKKEFKVKAGEEVTLTLKHAGKMAKDVMGHNWVLLKKGTDLAKFATGAMKAKDTDYIPADSDAVIAHTKLLGGGESDTITFKAPEEKGTYEFLCSFPGHYGAMQGKFIVE